MTIVQWLALVQTDEAAAADAWPTLSVTDRKSIRAAVARAKAGLVVAPVRALGVQLGAVIEDAELTALIATWPANGRLSEHLELELAASQQRGHALAPGEPVPGCGCPDCTGIPSDHPVRTVAHRRLQERLAAAQGARDGDAAQKERRRAWEQQVARARAVPILHVVARLGLGPPEGYGKEVRITCPFHADEHPSLALNPAKNVWYCHPCGEGGDAITLVMRVQEISFAAAVQELAG